jgi:carbon starvation protein
MKKDFWKILTWLMIGLIGSAAFSFIAISRGEKISALWLITACICIQLIGYRFYSLWIALKILKINHNNITPANKMADGSDFVATNKWIVFGHHFAAIAGPGPLIGPTLAAQFGYLPSTLWILIGSVLAGAVQDMIILFASVRNDAKSLGQMIKEKIGNIAGFAAILGTLMIIIILISVLALIVVKALMHSPWGSFTVLMTIPIAMLIGIYMTKIRPAAIFEASIIGITLFILAIFVGKFVNYHPTLSVFFDRDAKFIAFSIIFYGFMAATLPIWLLLAPRDYLSSFLKLGTIFLLIIAIFVFQPQLKMPPFTQFIDGNGPVFSGKIFPFLFITIACGAISGFHALVASGTTAKIINSENDIKMVGYGSMLLEGIVAIMAIIAASILEPGIYFAINSSVAALGSDISTSIATINSWGFEISASTMEKLAEEMGEKTLFSRTGGAPSLAVGLASIFSNAFGKSALSIWYHFAIMFEAIFILTTLDAGTRVARFMLQDLFANFCRPLGNAKDLSKINKQFSAIFSSFLIVAAWGYFLYIGVIDPNGGVNILWPIFGISNQMLAVIALCLASVVICQNGKKIYCLVTLIPLSFLLTIISTAVYQKIFSSDIKIGFLANIKSINEKISTNFYSSNFQISLAKEMIFNQKLLCSLTILFLLITYLVVFATFKKIIFIKNDEN